MKAAILTDSTATLNDRLLNHPDIYYVSLQLHFSSGETFIESEDRSILPEFYHRLKNAKELPKTSQARPQDFYAIYEELVDKGYDTVFFIPLSAVLSGTSQTGQSVASEFEDQIKTYVIDTGRAATPLRYLVSQALDLVEAGAEPEEVVTKIKWLNAHTTIWALVGDINNLVKGGRASRAQGLLGSLLKIVPLIEFDQEGNISVLAKVRTKRKALMKLADAFIEEAKKYSQGYKGTIAHADDESGAKELADLIREKLPDIEIEFDWLTPVVGTHGGTGTLATAVLPSLKNYLLTK
ncbi:DegV family protein [Aerococcus urinae]|uniref:DegV family protein n=1 Tax=Aerococcus urinae TaxID=1376 RepID=UPI0018A72CD5|nr:DegV family protein [Aerococcus urinae]